MILLANHLADFNGLFYRRVFCCNAPYKDVEV
jgi:hypothetical protein